MSYLKSLAILSNLILLGILFEFTFIMPTFAVGDEVEPYLSQRKLTRSLVFLDDNQILDHLNFLYEKNHPEKYDLRVVQQGRRGRG